MLIRNVDIGGRQCSVRTKDALIGEIAPDLVPDIGEIVLDGGGGALLPGLHDHHIHLNASAAALNSVFCGPPTVMSKDALLIALNAAPGGGWVRGIGYHQSVAGDIDAAWLDAHGPARPIRIQHRSGRLWIFNSAAKELLGGVVPADGRLFDGDKLIQNTGASTRPDLRPLVDQLFRYGIAGATEVTPGNDAADFKYIEKNARPLRLTIMGGKELHGHPPDSAILGPLKLHYHDHDLPSLDQLTKEIAVAHAAERSVAAHCVTEAELMLTLAAIEEAGVHPGDRIEHAAMTSDPSIEWIARLGLTVVTQPHFVVERGDAYKNDFDVEDRAKLWRLNSFLDAGIPLAAGSDAPFGGANPWASMAAAVMRPKGLGEREAISPEHALDLYTKPQDDAGAAPRKIEKGAAADMCLLTEPWRTVREKLCDACVRATWVGGRLIYDSMASTNPHSNAVSAESRFIDSAR